MMVTNVAADKMTHPDVLTQRELEPTGGSSTTHPTALKIAHERLNHEVARLGEELCQKNEELRRRDRLAALGEMAAGLAHEIRNPLGGIALYASMLERELAGHRSLATAGKIFHGVRSLENLVSEILDFAQEDRLERRNCCLDEMLLAVSDRVAREAEQSQVRVIVEPIAENAVLCCDPLRWQRVLVNLLLNAIQAAGAEGWARLTCSRAVDGVQFEVTDSGPGIPEDLLHRIFNPFFTTKASGTGLGLAICHRIVEAHGGTIRAGNGPGGARFVVWLPAEEQEGIECVQKRGTEA